MLWIQQIRHGRIPLTGPIIRKKAIEFAGLFSIVGFKASGGWFSKFKKRNGISYRPIVGDSDSVDRTVTDNWLQAVLLPLLAEYEDDDIYNLDEFALFWKALPNHTMSLKGERCCDGKFSKERLSVLGGTNMSGKHYYSNFDIN